MNFSAHTSKSKDLFISKQKGNTVNALQSMAWMQGLLSFRDLLPRVPLAGGRTTMHKTLT